MLKLKKINVYMNIEHNDDSEINRKLHWLNCYAASYMLLLMVCIAGESVMSASVDNEQQTDHGKIKNFTKYGSGFFIGWIAFNATFQLLTLYLVVNSISIGLRFVKMMEVDMPINWALAYIRITIVVVLWSLWILINVINLIGFSYAYYRPHEYESSLFCEELYTQHIYPIVYYASSLKFLGFMYMLIRLTTKLSTVLLEDAQKSNLALLQ